MLELNARLIVFPYEVIKLISKSIMEMIIVDMLPFSVVEGEAFIRVYFADPVGVRH